MTRRENQPTIDFAAARLERDVQLARKQAVETLDAVLAHTDELMEIVAELAEHQPNFQALADVYARHLRLLRLAAKASKLKKEKEFDGR